MLFLPKKYKHKKEHKGKAFNKLHNNVNFFKLKFGNIGLKTISFSRITSKQFVTIRQQIKKVLKKRGKLKINAFSFTPITKKAIGVRMGKGKGNVNHWVFKIKPGFVLCEIATNNISIALKAFNTIRFRIPVFTRIILF